MLYDPKWEKTETKVALTLAAFVAWLERQDPTTGYDWSNCRECAVAQFQRAMGYQIGDVERPLYSETFGGVKNYHAIVGTEPYTFGAALERARASHSSQQGRSE